MSRPTFDKACRRQFVRLLDGAKQHLWDGFHPCRDSDVFICNAVRKASKRIGLDHFRAENLLTDEIERRLGPDCISLRRWLAAEGIHPDAMTTQAVQAHRLAWINLMIEEFKA